MCVTGAFAEYVTRQAEQAWPRRKIVGVLSDNLSRRYVRKFYIPLRSQRRKHCACSCVGVLVEYKRRRQSTKCQDAKKLSTQLERILDLYHRIASLPDTV